MFSFSQHMRQMLKPKPTTHLANKSFGTGLKAPGIQRAGLLNQGSLERTWDLWPGMRGKMTSSFLLTPTWASLFPSIINVCNQPEGYLAVPRTWSQAESTGIFKSHDSLLQIPQNVSITPHNSRVNGPAWRSCCCMHSYRSMPALCHEQF